MKRFSLALAAAVVLLGLVLVVRTATFSSRQIQIAPAPSIRLDVDGTVARLAQAIRFKTVSLASPTDAGAGEFQKLREFLERSFPRVHRQLEREIINQHSPLFTWKGKDPSLKPILLMAHMDVVPVDGATEKSWTYPGFSGQVTDGYVWGRGAMDDKASVMAILEAVEHLLDANYAPRRTVYLAFGHDEEIGGANGAAKIAETLGSRGVELEFVIDEGMTILRGVIDGIDSPTALIGIAEKGYLTIQLTAQSAGGHSSIPTKENSIAALSRALERLESVPFPARVDGPTKQMLEFLGPEMSLANRIALANLWLFEPLVRRQMSGSPLTNAILRTTLAPTIFHAGVQDNVLPSEANAVVNLRVMPGETTGEALERVRKIVDDPQIKLSAAPIRVEPSAVTDSTGASFKLLQQTIRQIAPEAIVAPALLVAATDSRHYTKLTKNIFRFLPITLNAVDTKRYHGVDERISIDDYQRCIRFYAQLIRNADS